MRQSGFIAGVFLLLLVSILTDKSLRMITELTKHPRLKPLQVSTFEHLASLPFNKAGEYFVLVNMMVLAYGAMVAYLLIIKDTVPTLLGIDNGIEREGILLLTSILIIVPLAMLKDMATLSFTSFLSVMCDILLVFFVMIYSPIPSTVEENGGFTEVLLQDSVKPSLFVGLGIISTAMACQHSCFIVHNSLENNTSTRWATVTGSSISTAFILCTILAVCGYLGFLDGTFGDVLNNFDGDSIAANGARGLLAITMFFTYPMESFVARHVTFIILHEENREDDDSFLGTRHRISLLIYIATLIPALIFDDLGPVLSITGSLGGSCIAYIAPGMAYLGIYGEEFIALTKIICKKKKGEQSELELPVAGDARVKAATSNRVTESDLPIEGKASTVLQTTEIVQPWWWYPCLLPIWIQIASVASQNMNANLSQANTSPAQPKENDEIAAAPRGRDFVTAIFFIVFGVIAAIAGFVSIFFVTSDEQPYPA